jgi:hypothetical protein
MHAVLRVYGILFQKTETIFQRATGHFDIDEVCDAVL